MPLIGSQIAQTLNRAAVQRMVDAIAAGRTASTAARVVEFFGGLWMWAEKRGLVSGPNRRTELRSIEARQRTGFSRQRKWRRSEQCCASAP